MGTEGYLAPRSAHTEANRLFIAAAWSWCSIAINWCGASSGFAVRGEVHTLKARLGNPLLISSGGFLGKAPEGQ